MDGTGPVRITVISVSIPAMKDTILYSRFLNTDFPGTAEFSLHLICSDRDVNRFDARRANEDILSCDLLILDLMGADDGAVDVISESLKKAKCQRIIISGFGPIKNRLGGYDEKRFRTNPEDAGNVKLFADYWKNSEGEDVASAFNLVLRKYFGKDYLPDSEPISTSTGTFLKNPVTGRIYHSREEYLVDHPRDITKQNIVLFFNSHKYPYDSHKALRIMFSRFGEFCNVLPVAFNKITSADIPKIRELVSDDCDLAVDLIAFRFIAGPMGGSSTEAMKLLRDLNVPFLRPFFLGKTDIDEWKQRMSGLTVMEFMLNVFMAELDGAVCTFPVGANGDSWTAEEFGITVSEVEIIEDRLERLCGKIKGYLRLRKLLNSEKRIALVGYNYPPGEGNLFGGAFLDTFTSLCRIAEHLRSEGYAIPEIDRDSLVDEFLKSGLTNGGDWIDPDEDSAIYFKGRNEHPSAVTDKWGPAPGKVLTGRKGYLIPGVVKGNLFLGLQPPRVSPGSDTSKDYHDPYMPPHHQYLAFYEWIRDEFKADAVVHIGTHGTVEFLPGKEVGMSGDCYPDNVMGDIPHFYLYYMGNPSEAMIAKRRTHAGLISYMSPPYVRSGLYGGLSELEGLIAEYRESLFTDKGRSDNVLEIIRSKAAEMRLPDDVDELEHELDDMRLSLIPKGFHIFGTPFDRDEAEEFAIQSMMFSHEGAVPMTQILEENNIEGDPVELSETIYRRFNADRIIPECVASDERTLPSLEYEKKVFEEAMTCHELSNLSRALNSEFIDVKPGDDVLRTPEVLPTGYNIVQFDPNKIPTMAAFERGAEAANNTINMHLADEGTFPKSVALVMWGLETSRSQGATIGQIMTYLGIRMVDTSGSFEERFEIIPIEELGRPRIDVTVSICGFFRDMFSGIVTGLNRVFRRLWETGETDEQSMFAKHTRENLEKLKAEGYSDEDALDLAVCRLFGPKEGLYGTGMTGTVNSSQWDDESELGNIFEDSLKHAYSLKRRGFDSGDLLKTNHAHVDVVSQIRQNVEYELIDLDHYYEFFGGLSKTVELARGSRAKMYITDNTGPRLKTQTVKSSIEHGVRTRLLNPKWIDGMLETDYHGAQKINDRFENVLGLAATTGAVESGVFSDMESVYVKDPEMRRRLQENNNFAYIGMLTRLSEAYRRKYWNASPEELRELEQAFLESEEIAEGETDRDH
ncbi:MAG: cobaltochelatase subunit CobN [archaeon]|nr:cobaltochelatase subunit CobN [archaeon]